MPGRPGSNRRQRHHYLKIRATEEELAVLSGICTAVYGPNRLSHWLRDLAVRDAQRMLAEHGDSIPSQLRAIAARLVVDRPRQAVRDGRAAQRRAKRPRTDLPAGCVQARAASYSLERSLLALAALGRDSKAASDLCHPGTGRAAVMLLQRASDPGAGEEVAAVRAAAARSLQELSRAATVIRELSKAGMEITDQALATITVDLARVIARINTAAKETEPGR